MSKQKSKEHVLIENMLGSKTVSFYPDFARALGSVPAGVFMAQGFFLQFKSEHTEFVEFGGRKYFLHTMKDWEKETALSEDQQIRARKILVESGIMREKLAGIPAKLHFHFDFEVLAEVMVEYKNRALQDAVEAGNKFPGNPGTVARETKKQVAGKTGNNYIGRELKESLREEEGERQNPAPSLPETFPLEEKKEKEKIPGGGAAAQRYQHQVFQNAQTQEPFSLESGIAEIRGNQIMRDAFSMTRRVPAELFEGYLTEFGLEQAAVDSTHHNLADFRKHFLNYSAKRYESEQKRKALASPKTKSAAPRAWGGDETDYTAPQAF